MTHQPAPCDVDHDTQLDVTEARRPTPSQRRALDVLGIDPGHHPLVRLSLADWRICDRVTSLLPREPS